MTVDFEFGRAPEYRVGSISWKGAWSEKSVRSHFDEVARWAKSQGVRTGKWIFREPDDRDFEVCIEIKGRAQAAGKVKLRTLPASSIARVVFNPDDVSPRVIYHGLNDWLRWRKKDHDIKSAGSYRELYDGDPWRNARAWAHTEIQRVVRK